MYLEDIVPVPTGGSCSCPSVQIASRPPSSVPTGSLPAGPAAHAVTVMGKLTPPGARAAINGAKASLSTLASSLTPRRSTTPKRAESAAKQPSRRAARSPPSVTLPAPSRQAATKANALSPGTALLYDDDMVPTTVAEAVALDMVSTPSWRDYRLKLQVFKMMLAKDRTLPMTQAARSPRHLEQSKWIMPPPRPKPPSPSKMVRKEAEEDVEAAARMAVPTAASPRGAWQLLRHAGMECNQAISAGFLGFLDADLEVQVVVMFLAISACVSMYNYISHAVVVASYDDGRAPPAPPSQDWVVSVSESFFSFALSSPVAYLLIDFGIAVVIGIIVSICICIHVHIHTCVAVVIGIIVSSPHAHAHAHAHMHMLTSSRAHPHMHMHMHRCSSGRTSRHHMHMHMHMHTCTCTCTGAFLGGHQGVEAEEGAAAPRAGGESQRLREPGGQVP